MGMQLARTHTRNEGTQALLQMFLGLRNDIIASIHHAAINYLAAYMFMFIRETDKAVFR